jgi:hypothetical protein
VGLFIPDLALPLPWFAIEGVAIKAAAAAAIRICFI